MYLSCDYTDGSWFLLGPVYTPATSGFALLPVVPGIGYTLPRADQPTLPLPSLPVDILVKDSKVTVRNRFLFNKVTTPLICYTRVESIEAFSTRHFVVCMQTYGNKITTKYITVTHPHPHPAASVAGDR